MTEQSPKTLTKQELRKAQQRIFFLPTERFAKKLGKHISLARRKRCLTQKMLAERALLSLATLQRLEKGDSSVSMAAVMRVLFILDGLKSFDDLLAPAGDEFGREAIEARLPKRVRPKTGYWEA